MEIMRIKSRKNPNAARAHEIGAQVKRTLQGTKNKVNRTVLNYSLKA